MMVGILQTDHVSVSDDDFLSSSPRFRNVSLYPALHLYVLTLPTSGMVYEDAEVLYAEVAKDGTGLIEEAFQVLFPNSVPLTPETKLQPNTSLNQIIGYNSTFLSRREIVKIPLLGASAGLKTAVAQVDEKTKAGYAIMNNGVLDASVANNLTLHASGASQDLSSMFIMSSLQCAICSIHQWFRSFRLAELKCPIDHLQGPNYQSP